MSLHRLFFPSSSLETDVLRTLYWELVFCIQKLQMFCLECRNRLVSFSVGFVSIKVLFKDITATEPLHWYRDDGDVMAFLTSLWAFKNTVIPWFVSSQFVSCVCEMVTEQYDVRKGIPYEDASFRLTCRVFKSVNEKCMLEEFSVIGQRLLVVCIIQFC